MRNSICRLTRASSAHLATAQGHAGAAARWRAAAKIYAAGGNGELAAYSERQAARSEALARRAMARHEAARAKLGA